MSSTSGPPAEEEELSHEDAEARLQAMRMAVQEQMRQINILEMDAAEHVLEALEPLDAGRKCFRMVGSVIVERTVGDVKPALQKNLEQMKELNKKLTEATKSQQLAADAFAAKYRLSNKPGAQMQQQEESEEASGGVLI